MTCKIKVENLGLKYIFDKKKNLKIKYDSF